MVKKIRAKVLEKIYDEFSKTLLQFAELNSFEIFTVKGSSHIVLILYVKDFPVFFCINAAFYFTHIHSFMEKIVEIRACTWKQLTFAVSFPLCIQHLLCNNFCANLLVVKITSVA